jgi:Na+-transporting NADH:ubiquinone oxidoreductase subunit NqrF
VRITILGKASGRKQELELLPQEMTENLMDWLRRKNITIASSCDGEGVCKKCVIQNDWLTCQLTMEEFLQSQPDGLIIVSYL